MVKFLNFIQKVGHVTSKIILAVSNLLAELITCSSELLLHNHPFKNKQILHLRI